VLSSRDELIRHHLSRVCEVAKLGLPNHQGGRILVAVAKLEPHHAVLCEDGVPCDEGLLWAQVQVVEEAIIGPRLLILDDTMTMSKSASLHILPSDTHMVALQEEAAEG